MKHAFALMLFFALAGTLPAQNAGEPSGTNVTFAPLYLSINGNGRVLPLADGQMLCVGRTYQMCAVANPGAVFTNWVRLNVYTLKSTLIDNLGGFPVTNYDTSVDVTREPEDFHGPLLSFTQEPEELIYASVSTSGWVTVTNDSLTLTHGWEANFVPAPKARPNAPAQRLLTAD